MASDYVIICSLIIPIVPIFSLSRTTCTCEVYAAYWRVKKLFLNSPSLGDYGWKSKQRIHPKDVCGRVLRVPVGEVWRRRDRVVAKEQNQREKLHETVWTAAWKTCGRYRWRCRTAGAANQGEKKAEPTSRTGMFWSCESVYKRFVLGHVLLRGL